MRGFLWTRKLAAAAASLVAVQHSMSTGERLHSQADHRSVPCAGLQLSAAGADSRGIHISGLKRGFPEVLPQGLAITTPTLLYLVR